MDSLQDGEMEAALQNENNKKNLEYFTWDYNSWMITDTLQKQLM